MIPKNGQPGKFRPLGIPTVADRVVQAAVKNVMESIFEADFSPTSYGFRPGRSVHAALEHLKILLQPRRARRWGREEALRANASMAQSILLPCIDDPSGTLPNGVDAALSFLVNIYGEPGAMKAARRVWRKAAGNPPGQPGGGAGRLFY